MCTAQFTKHIIAIKPIIHFSALEALINFAYSGRVVLDKSNVQSIMIGASFLQLNKVRDACANYLLQR